MKGCGRTAGSKGRPGTSKEGNMDAQQSLLLRGAPSLPSIGRSPQKRSLGACNLLSAQWRSGFLSFCITRLAVKWRESRHKYSSRGQIALRPRAMLRRGSSG